MEDKIIIAIIAAVAAILGGLISGMLQYKIARKNVLGDEMKIGLEILKERIDRIETVKKNHLEALNTEDTAIKDATDMPTIIALGAMSAVKIGDSALKNYGYLLPEASVQELQLILDRINDCKKTVAEGGEMIDDPIKLSFKFNDDIGKLIDTELRSLGSKVDRILTKAMN